MAFWCIDGRGVPLFFKDFCSNNFDVLQEKMEIISGLFYTIEKLSSIALNEKLRYIVFEKSKLMFKKFSDRDLYFVVQVALSANNTQINNHLKKLIHHFMTAYSSDFEKWDGEINAFSQFVDQIMEM